MSEAYRKLCENLPVRRAPTGAVAFPTEPKRVKGWIEALPRANQAATFRQLSEGLDTLVEVRLEGSQRLAILELLRPTLLDALSALDQQAQGGTIPLPPAKQRAIEQLQAFERQLALQYRLAAAELCAPNGSLPFLRGGTVAQAIERATYHYARCLMHAYFLYQEPEPGLWSAMHALYGFARSHKLEDKAIEEPTEHGSVSTDQIYSLTLLIALSNPFRFSQKEQADLWVLCRDLAPHLGLHPVRHSEDSFAIPLDHDEGPGYIPEERAAGEGNLLWLDLEALKRAIEAPLATTTSGPLQVSFKQGRPVNTTAELLRRLRGGWGTAASRQAQRLSAGHSLHAVIGLSGVHYHLAGHTDFDTFLRQVGAADALSERGRERASWTQGGIEPGRMPQFRTEVLDQSLGGYRVHWPKEENVRARVGELIGLAVADGEDERQWMLGVIRWLRYANDRSVDAGIELLARRARPVAICHIDAQDARHPPRPPLRAVQYEPVRQASPKSLRFAVASMLDAAHSRIEVVRLADLSDIENDDPLREGLTDVTVLENAGDFLLIETIRS